MSQNKILRVNIKDGDYTISFSGPRDKISPEYIAMMIRESRKAINAMENNSPAIHLDIPEADTETVKQMIESTPIVPVTTEPKNDCFNIRDRLPNNVVDPATLEINTATNEKALVRCPSCGQAHAAIIVKSQQENYLMVFNSDKKEFIFVSHEPITAGEVNGITLDLGQGVDTKEHIANKKKFFYEDLQKLLKKEDKPSDVVVYENTSIYCPVCGETNSFSNWKKAYYHPLDYFETEHPCIVCGGEMLSYVDKKTQRDKTHATTRCDSCGHKEIQEVK